MDKPPRSTPPDRHAPDAARPPLAPVGRPPRHRVRARGGGRDRAAGAVDAVLDRRPCGPGQHGGHAAPAACPGVTASGLPPPAPHAPPEGDADPTRDLSSYVSRAAKSRPWPK
ncbi:hypothetical protein LP420_39500 [Massilia sp. B-10]|nr:hypothetical protein LP420_39500 [Massilia sp. B-10]